MSSIPRFVSLSGSSGSVSGENPILFLRPYTLPWKPASYFFFFLDDQKKCALFRVLRPVHLAGSDFCLWNFVGAGNAVGQSLGKEGAQNAKSSQLRSGCFVLRRGGHWKKKFERRKTSPKPYDDYVNDDASGAITQCQGRLMFPWPSLWEVRFFFLLQMNEKIRVIWCVKCANRSVSGVGSGRMRNLH